MTLKVIDQPRLTFNEVQRPSALKLLFWAFSASVLLRIFLTDNILNLWINYTAEAGSIVEKIHPGSYALIAICLAALLTRRIVLDARALRTVRALLVLLATIGVLCAWMAASGRANSAGYLIDSYVVACLAGMAIYAFPPEWRAAFGGALLAALTPVRLSASWKRL